MRVCVVESVDGFLIAVGCEFLSSLFFPVLFAQGECALSFFSLFIHGRWMTQKRPWERPGKRLYHNNNNSELMETTSWWLMRERMSPNCPQSTVALLMLMFPPFRKNSNLRLVSRRFCWILFVVAVVIDVTDKWGRLLHESKFMSLWCVARERDTHNSQGPL